MLLPHDLTAQIKQEQPYNRFQYHNYKWRAFHTKAFHIYFPKGYDSLCSFVARELLYAIKVVKHNMGTDLLRAPQVVIYPSPDQLYESNIGMYETEPKTFPTFIAKGTRLVIAYVGNYDDLKEQLYEALAREIWESQLKESLEQQANGVVGTEDVPFWYKEGAIRYFARQWPIAAEDELRRSYQDKRFNDWQECIAYQPRLSGQAFCYFLTQRYYPLAALQLYSQTKKKKNLARSVRFITKHSLDTVMAQCHEFYRSRFLNEIDAAEKESYSSAWVTMLHKKGIIRDVQVNSDGSEITYTAFRSNTRTVYMYHTQTQKTDKLKRYHLPPWINDYSRDIYPYLKWNNDGNELSLVKPVKGKTSILSFASTGGLVQTNAINNADGITSLKQTSNEDYLLAAFQRGVSDIVSYSIEKEEYTPFTNDTYDDSHPAGQNNDVSRLVFVSKRKEKEPSADQKRTIGFKDTSKLKRGLYLLQNKIIVPVITDSTSYVKWDKPVLISNSRLLATTTQYGREQFVVFNGLGNKNYELLNSYYPVQYHENSKEISYSRTDKDSIYLYRKPTDEWIQNNKTSDTTSPWLDDYRRNAAQRAKEDSLLKAAHDESPSFLEGVLMPKDAKEQAKRREDSIARSQAYDPKRVKPYVLQLHSAYFTAKVNNDYFINRYQPYKNYQGQFKFPELGGMAQGGFTDLLENHHVNIAFRLPAATEGSDFFVRYENTAKKIDWGIAYFRKVESLQPDPLRNWADESGRPYPNLAKVKTHYGEVNAHHPITYYLSADFTEAIRYDRTIFLATDTFTLKYEDIRSLWSITSLSITYNKLLPTLPFLHKGFKSKLLMDIFQPLDESGGPTLGASIQLQYHLPIYKYITWVTQLQAGRSVGQSYVLYNLAGLDNNVTVKVDSNVHAKQNTPYVFQTLITPLRGYLQNTVAGNSYHVWNNDVYFPLFQTLIPIETPLQFINLLQPGLFADLGMAQETWTTTSSIPNNGNWVWSYGVSARTSLAGYPLRFDVAWPGTFSKKPVWYFSLSLK